MKLILEIDGVGYPVTVRADENTYTVSLEDRSYSIDVARRAGSCSSALSLLVGSESVEAWAVPMSANGGYHVSVLGESFDVEVEDALRYGLKKMGAAAAIETEEVIRAPMPGVVVEVLAEPGQVVTPGSAVLIIEAMKMRNEFGPTSPGRLRSVLVEPGQSVERNQELAIIDLDGDPSDDKETSP